MGTRGGARPGAGRKPGSRNNSNANVVSLPKTQHGGARPGAGRKPVEMTQVRVPFAMQKDVMRYVENKGFNLPIYSTRVPMGSPQLSEPHADETFNLNDLVKHPHQTYCHRVQGDSMEPTVVEGDLAMIDHFVEPLNGDVVLAYVNGGFTLKRLRKAGKQVWLEPDNPKHKTLFLDTEGDAVCGVMLYSVRPISTNHVQKF